MSAEMSYNESFIKILGELEDIMTRQGEQFRARAYHKAVETIMTCNFDITNPNQLAGKANIGETIMSKLIEYVETGTLGIIEKKKTDPLNILTKVYGIGPKKAQDLIKDGIDTLDKLRLHQDNLTAAQKIGLEFFNDIETPIPRAEIDAFRHAFNEVFAKNTPEGSRFEIVGSYRRGKNVSGDIDVIITNSNNNKKTFDTLIDALIKTKLLTHILSRGQTKCLTLAKLASNPSRRVDLMYSPPDEYAFAVLYFTGSKSFNTMQRQRALDMGFTLNEHGIHTMIDGNKGSRVAGNFLTERSIFGFLQMEYKEPCERKDGRSVVIEEKITIKRCKVVKDTITSMTMIQSFKKHGTTFLETLPENEIVDIIYNANQSYHENSDPIMTDEQYDILLEYACEKYPDNKKIKAGGHTTIEMMSSESTKAKVQLPYEMWSMDKIKPDTTALTKWNSKYKGPYVVTCKLDGVSCLYVSPDKLYTRGNGKVGQDVSNLIPYLRLPKDRGIVIRGELIIKKNIFLQKYSKEFANPRNFVAGVVNQKTPHTERLRDISFVAYEVIHPAMKPSVQLSRLTAMDIETVQYTMSATLSNELLSQSLTIWREDYMYEIDGVICCNDEVYARLAGNPEHAFAFKMVLSDQVVEAKVVSVIWSASKDGYLKPRVQIEPIILGGVSIEYATGFNGKFIVDNKIGVGAVVALIRSGDVIPHIMSVVKPADEPLMPSDEYIWNETGVDIVLVDKMNDSSVNHKVITLFFKTIGVDGLGPGNVKKIIDAGFNTIPLIISMKREQYLEIEGFKQKMSDKIYDGIKQKMSEASLPLLMDATNIFGRGFGEKKFQSILLELPDIIVSKSSIAIKISEVEKVSGIAFKTAQRFVEKIPEFVEWAKCAGVESKLSIKLVTTPLASKEHPLYGKKIAITGFRDKELVAAFEHVGAINVNAITKDVFLVIVKDYEVDTSKVEMAKKLDIPIMMPKTFIQKFIID